jgi:nicotinamidase/pyrazinamidase
MCKCDRKHCIKKPTLQDCVECFKIQNLHKLKKRFSIPELKQEFNFVDLKKVFSLSELSQYFPLKKFNMLLVDEQIDFHEGGGLPVPGATADSERISNLLSSYHDMLNLKVLTLDTHTLGHIGFPGYWKSIDDGSEPVSWTVFSYDQQSDTIKGSMGDIVKTYEPKNTSLLSWTKDYVKNVASYGKGPALIWPLHCLEGTNGHRVVPQLKTVLDTLPDVEYRIKGQNELTEMYSVFKAEIPAPTNLSTKDIAYTQGITTTPSVDGLIKIPKSDVADGYFLNTFFNELLYQKIKTKPLLICGQALSHCVNWSTRDYVNRKLIDIGNTTLPENDVILIIDGCSPIPGFESSVTEFLAFCKETNVKITTCDKIYDELFSYL